MYRKIEPHELLNEKGARYEVTDSQNEVYRGVLVDWRLRNADDFEGYCLFHVDGESRPWEFDQFEFTNVVKL